MENHFVGDLKELGYNAVSSLQEYGPKAFNKMDEESKLGKIKTTGGCCHHQVVLLDKKKRKKKYILVIFIIQRLVITITGFGAIEPQYIAELTSRDTMSPTPNIFWEAAL